MQILSLYYSPGQKVSLFLETLNASGIRTDGYTVPVVNRIFLPSLLLSTGLPTNMTKVDVGLYTYQFTLPINATSIGSYLVDVSYNNPANNLTNTALYQVIVTAPFGNYSVGT